MVLRSDGLLIFRIVDGGVEVAGIGGGSGRRGGSFHGAVDHCVALIISIFNAYLRAAHKQLITYTVWMNSTCDTA